jgi:hypothetical protein
VLRSESLRRFDPSTTTGDHTLLPLFLLAAAVVVDVAVVVGDMFVAAALGHSTQMDHA